MSKKIIYWTGVYSPEHEAVSKEIYLLHNHFTSSFVYGISSNDYLKLSFREKYFVHYNRPYRLAPKLIPFVEKAFDLSHIYHSMNNRYFIDNLQKKPIILTAATGGVLLDKKLYERIDKIVAESEYDLERLKSAGFQEGKLTLIYPGLDLNQFSYQEPNGEFSILFASSPFSKEYFDARGVNLLLSATEAFNNVHFTLLWRKWADTVNLIKPMVQYKQNVTLLMEHIKDIGELLNNVHAVIAPFTSQQLAKPCPHSIIESLAAGKPVLVTDKVGIAHIIEKAQCGVVFKPDKDALIDAINELRTNYAHYQINARKCAETYFSQDVFLKQYESLYHELF